MGMSFVRDVAIVGGCGRVGLPLGLVFADAGSRSRSTTGTPRPSTGSGAGKMPFFEHGADALLEHLLGTGRLKASDDPTLVADAEHVVVVVGTPVDEHLNPDPGSSCARSRDCSTTSATARS